MNIQLNFTQEEKEQFLTAIGYKIVDFDYDYWDQWGNHDSQGNWKTRTMKCAVKDTEPSINNGLEGVFNTEMSAKIKKLLLTNFNW